MNRSRKIAFVVILGVPLVCAFGGFIVFVSAGGNAAGRLATEKTAAKKIGMPLEVSDLDIHPVPADKNAAPIYRQLGELTQNRFKAQQAVLGSGWSKKATPEQKRAADAVLSEMGPVFELVDQLGTHPQCNFGRDWSKGVSLLFPELAGMKAVVRDLCAKADLQDRQGDWRAAFSTIGKAKRVAADAGSDPILIGMLVQIACSLIIDREYESLIGRHSRDGRFLAEASESLRSHNELPDERRFMGGEIVFERTSFRTAESLRDFGSEEERPSELERSIFKSQILRDTLDANVIHFWRIAWAEFPNDPNDWQSYHKALADLQTAVDRDKSLLNTINQMIMPVFSQASDAVGNLQAHDRLLETSIELLRARLAKGTLPTALPPSLGKAALDPFDGKQLRYKRQASGFILYSIGQDRQDNGGHVRLPGDSSTTGYDEVVKFP